MQYNGVQGFKTVLQYSLLGSSVLQYTTLYCGMRHGCLCCKTGGCVVTRRWAGALGARLGARGAQAGAGSALGAQAAGAGARRERHGVGSQGRAERRRVRGSRRGIRAGPARPGYWARGLGARHAAWVHGLATGCALGLLGLFSIQFYSVLFLSRFLDIVREPGS